MKPTIWIALLLAALLAGCALEPRRVEPPPATRIIVQPSPPSATDQLLVHVTKVRKLEAREFAAERESARSEFQQDKNDFNRVRYALMLALTPVATSPVPASAAQDDTELISLIDPLLVVTAPGGAPLDPEVAALAALLHGAAIDRRKLREQLRETQMRLVLARKDDSREAEARALRARVEELETRLNALKSIDRSVNRRAEPVRK